MSEPTAFVVRAGKVRRDGPWIDGVGLPTSANEYVTWTQVRWRAHRFATRESATTYITAWSLDARVVPLVSLRAGLAERTRELAERNLHLEGLKASSLDWSVFDDWVRKMLGLSLSASVIPALRSVVLNRESASKDIAAANEETRKTLALVREAIGLPPGVDPFPAITRMRDELAAFRKDADYDAAQRSAAANPGLPTVEEAEWAGMHRDVELGRLRAERNELAWALGAFYGMCPGSLTPVQLAAFKAALKEQLDPAPPPPRPNGHCISCRCLGATGCDWTSCPCGCHRGGRP